MSEAKRTRRPWELFRLSRDSDEDERLIVTAHNHETEVCGIVQNEADARLIAAAPDLLKAAKAIVLQDRLYGVGHLRERTHRELRWAVEKAEGGNAT